MESTCRHAEIGIAAVLPIDEEQHELLQTVGLHVLMIDDIETEVEQILVLAGIRLQHGTDVEFQFVENLFIYITVGIDEITEELILFQ